MRRIISKVWHERENITVFTVYIFSSVCNYLYQVYVGRALGPKDYGIFGALFAIVYVISVFSNSIQAGSAWAITKLATNKETADLNFVIYSLIKKTIYLGVFGFALFSLISPIISKSLNIDSIQEVTIVGTVILLYFPLAATLGIFQGLQRFYHLSLANIFTFFPKLVFAIFLVDLGYGVLGAIGALSLGMMTAFLFSLFLLRSNLRARTDSKRYDFKDLYIYSIPSTAIMLCLAMPSNLDVIFSRYFFSEYDAGLYTAASVIGKIILFLPSSILVIMFPKASEMNILDKRSLKLLNISLICTALLSGAASSLIIIYPQIVEIIFGHRYDGAAEIVPFYAFMMFLFSLVWTIAYYCLAVGYLKYTYIILLFTLAEILLISIVHESIFQMIWILAAGSFLLLIIGYIYILFQQKIDA